MRIALVSPFLTHRGMGVSRYVANLVPHLCDAGCEITIIGTDCVYRGAAPEELLVFDPRATLRMFPVKGKVNRRLYRSYELISWLQCHARDFDLVDIQGIWHWIGMDAADICYDAGLPFVLTSHGHMTSYEWKRNGIAKQLFFPARVHRVWQRAARVRYLSEGELKNSKVWPVRPYEIISQGITLPNLRDLPAPDAGIFHLLGAAPDDIVILFFGRITAGKGVVELLDAFDLLRAECPRVHLAIVGPLDGTYGEMIQERIKADKKGRVSLVGPVFDERKWAVLATAKLFVTLSKSEGGSVAVLEALGMGIPVCITPGTNMPEVESAQAGITTSCEPNVAARNIAELLQDTARLAAMSQNAKRLADTFKWETVLPRLLGFYERALSSSVEAAVRTGKLNDSDESEGGLPKTSEAEFLSGHAREHGR